MLSWVHRCALYDGSPYASLSPETVCGHWKILWPLDSAAGTRFHLILTRSFTGHQWCARLTVECLLSFFGSLFNWREKTESITKRRCHVIVHLAVVVSVAVVRRTISRTIIIIIIILSICHPLFPFIKGPLNAIPENAVHVCGIFQFFAEVSHLL